MTSHQRIAIAGAGTIYVNVKVAGEAMRPEHLRRIRKYLELAEQDWGGTRSDDDAQTKSETPQ